MSLSGVYSVLVTPFAEDESLDTASLRRLIDFYVDLGVDGVLVLGVLGEADRMSDAERELVAATAVEHAAGRVPVTVGITHGATVVAVERARAAERLGAAAVMAAPPSGLPPSRAHFERIRDAVSIPLVVQDHPPSSGVELSVDLLAGLGDVVVKLEDPPTAPKIAELRAAAPSMPIMGGLGGVSLLAELEAGAVGTMTGFAFAEALVEIVAAHRSGDLDRARRTFERTLPLMEFEARPGGGAALRKEILRRRGAIAHATVRAPADAPDSPTLAALSRLLEAAEAAPSGGGPPETIAGNPHACRSSPGWRRLAGRGHSSSMVSTPPTIAGSTLVLAVRPRDRPASELEPGDWAHELGELRAAGFEAVDLVDSWLAPGAMSRGALADLRAVLDNSGLALAGVSVIRRSVIDPVSGAENLDFTLRSVEAAAALGAPVVSIGFHRPLTARQKQAQFWMVPGPEDERDERTWAVAAARVGRVAVQAAALGLEISLELHEGTLLDSPEGAVRIIERSGASNVGINPDLGNLIRVPGPLAAGWEELLRDSLPHMNFWHVKNYLRLEHPASGVTLSYPADLESGVIDYRAALRLALAAGYHGPICIEHYEGDAVWAIAKGRRYLEEVMCTLEVAV